MVSSVATAQHLQKVGLWLRKSDINFLKSCLSSLSHNQSLQELDVKCNASGVFLGCAVCAGIINVFHECGVMFVCNASSEFCVSSIECCVLYR